LPGFNLFSEKTAGTFNLSSFFFSKFVSLNREEDKLNVRLSSIRFIFTFCSKKKICVIKMFIKHM